MTCTLNMPAAESKETVLYFFFLTVIFELFRKSLQRTFVLLFCNALLHIHTASLIRLGSPAVEPHVCFCLLLQYKAGKTVGGHAGPVVAGRGKELWLQPRRRFSALIRATLSFPFRCHHLAFQSLLQQGLAVQRCISIQSEHQRTPFSLTGLIHAALFSVHTHLLFSLMDSTGLCTCKLPFVVPIMNISPAVLSTSSPPPPPFQSLLFTKCSAAPPPACLHPHCRVGSSLFLLALSRLAPIRICLGLITRWWR